MAALRPFLQQHDGNIVTLTAGDETYTFPKPVEVKAGRFYGIGFDHNGVGTVKALKAETLSEAWAECGWIKLDLMQGGYYIGEPED